jgi:heat shock protein HslJ
VRHCLTALALFLASCTSVVADTRTFEGTSWRVVAVNAQPLPPGGGGRGYSLTFGHGGVMGGGFGCNHIGGKYRVRGEVMVVTDLHTTLMGCPEPIATIEQTGFAILGQPMRMRWEAGRRLTLGNAAGSIALERPD